MKVALVQPVHPTAPMWCCAGARLICELPDVDLIDLGVLPSATVGDVPLLLPA